MNLIVEETGMERDINYQSFLKLDVAQFTDKWVAIVGGKLIAVRDNFKEVYNEAREKFPRKRPLVAKIPPKRVMIL